MSVEVELNTMDYHNVMNWYELAFAKKKPSEIAMKEHSTFRKLSVMAEAYIEEQKQLDKDDKELAWQVINQVEYMGIIVATVVTMMKFILEAQIVSVYAMTKNNTELRYERLLRDFDVLVKKLKRKQMQLIEIRAKLGISEEK